MATRRKRADENSTSRQVAAFQHAHQVIAPPPGVRLRSDEERVIWDQFTRARAKDDWRDMDLILLGKIVRTEATMNELQEALDRQGYILANPRGTQIENPLVRTIDTLQRQQLAIIRSMSLNTTATDPRTKANQAKTEADARKALEDGGIESLLAQPMN
jgi:hypothetical protein